MSSEKLFLDITQAGEPVVRKGGRPLARWAYDQTKLILEAHDVVSILVRIVPQVGENAGKLLEYPRDLPEIFIKNKSESLVNSTRIIGKESDRVLVVPIDSGFDRPVGSILVQLGETKDLNEVLMSVEGFACQFSRCIRLVRTSVAYDMLSESFHTSFNMQRDIKSLIDHVVSICRDAVGCKDVGFWRIKDKDGVMKLETATRPYNADMEVGVGVAGTCAEKKKEIRVDDLLDKKEVKIKCGTEVEHELLVKQMGWRSAVFIPLGLGRLSGGVLSLYSGRVSGINNVDITIARAFADRIEYAYNLAVSDKALRLYEHLKSISPAMERAIDIVSSLHDAYDEIDDIPGDVDKMLLGSMSKDNENIARAIKTNANTARELLKGFKDQISVVSSDKVSIRKHNIEKVLEKTLLRLTVSTQSKGITLSTVVPSGLELEVDKFRLISTVRNLIQNAMDSLNVSQIHSRKKRIEFNVTPANNEVTFSVTDNGIGIPEDIIEEIFDIFFTTKATDGFGLGLFQASRNVYLHGGTLKVNVNKSSQLTEFNFTIPRKD